MSYLPPLGGGRLDSEGKGLTQAETQTFPKRVWLCCDVQPARGKAMCHRTWPEVGLGSATTVEGMGGLCPGLQGQRRPPPPRVGRLGLRTQQELVCRNGSWGFLFELINFPPIAPPGIWKMEAWAKQKLSRRIHYCRDSKTNVWWSEICGVLRWISVMVLLLLWQQGFLLLFSVFPKCSRPKRLNNQRFAAKRGFIHKAANEEIREHSQICLPEPRGWVFTGWRIKQQGGLRCGERGGKRLEKGAGTVVLRRCNQLPASARSQHDLGADFSRSGPSRTPSGRVRGPIQS